MIRIHHTIFALNVNISTLKFYIDNWICIFFFWKMLWFCRTSANHCRTSTLKFFGPWWCTCVFRLSHTSRNTTFFPKPWLLFSHASAEVRGENTPEKKFASTSYQTHNHQVMSLTRSPLSRLDRTLKCWTERIIQVFSVKDCFIVGW